MDSSLAELAFRATCALYAGALAGQLGALLRARSPAGRVASALAGAGLAAHTVLLGARWQQAAAAEVAASGAGWPAALFAHPPLTNLYESLIFVAWCAVAVALLVEARFKLKGVGLPALGIALAALVEAWLVAEKAAHPLVPALQSWWLATHVVVLFVAYALFLVAAALALFSLLKAGTPLAAFGLAFSLGAAGLVVAGGAGRGLLRLAFELTPLAQHRGGWEPAIYLPVGASSPARLGVAVPGVGIALALAVVLLLAASLLFARELGAGRDAGTSGRGFFALVAGIAALAAGLGALAIQVGAGRPVELALPAQAVAAGIAPPLRLSFQGNLGLGLPVLALALAGAFAAVAAFRTQALARLPERARLDELTYRLVLTGFPLLGFGIVMGAFWAYDAWGSYWSWDPKETWSLVTFLAYAFYLHTRRTLGWSGRRGAVIAIVGFALVLFTYLGVNLGLTGEGLHTYGNR